MPHGNRNRFYTRRHLDQARDNLARVAYHIHEVDQTFQPARDRYPDHVTALEHVKALIVTLDDLIASLKDAI